jgi:general secretion pathway protein G
VLYWLVQPQGDPVLRRIRAIRHSDSDAGFTLTELLITIIILGVLAAIVVFAVGAFNKTGDTAACQTDKRAVQVAVDAYFAQTKAYPATIAALVAANYLHDAPSTANGYTITLNTTTGVVTAVDGSGNPAC